MPEGMYFVTAAAKSAAALPDAVPALSVYVDRDDSERKRALQNALDVPRLDALALERNETIRRQMDHVRHLRGTRRRPGSHHRRTGSELAAIRAAREPTVRAIDAQTAERQQLEAALAAQQRLLAFRNSFVGWLRWPPMRARLLWRQWTGR